jgi:hypothetical protein
VRRTQRAGHDRYRAEYPQAGFQRPLTLVSRGQLDEF